MRIRNVNPLGAVEFPLIRRVLEAGEVFEVPDPVGEALLLQLGNFEQVTDDTDNNPADGDPQED